MDSEDESENEEYSSNLSNHIKDDANETTYSSTTIIPQDLQLDSSHQVSSRLHHITDDVENIEDTQEIHSGRDNFI